MSEYRLLFARNGALSLYAFQAFLARRAFYRVDGASAAYRCEDTHASFTFRWVHPQEAPALTDPRLDGDVGAVLEIPLVRAPFVVEEANREVAALVDHFGLHVVDPQHDPTVMRLHDASLLASRWAQANRAAIAERVQQPGAVPLSLPAAALTALHRWNQQRVALAAALDASVHIPRIEVSAYQREAVTWVGWSDSEPIALPTVDLVVVSHEPRGLRRLVDHDVPPELAPWAEVEPLLASLVRDEGPPPFYVVRKAARLGSDIHRWLHLPRPPAEPVTRGRRDLSALIAREDLPAT